MALIETTLGFIDETELLKRVGHEEDENEIVNWVEYRKDGVVVHRSVDIQLKKGVLGDLYAASFT